jgi:hypothetical protein
MKSQKHKLLLTGGQISQHWRTTLEFFDQGQNYQCIVQEINSKLELLENKDEDKDYRSV